MPFIKLTDTRTGKPAILNLDKLVKVEPNPEGGTIIVSEHRPEFHACEPYQDVEDALVKTGTVHAVPAKDYMTAYHSGMEVILRMSRPVNDAERYAISGVVAKLLHGIVRVPILSDPRLVVDDFSVIAHTTAEVTPSDEELIGI